MANSRGRRTPHYSAPGSPSWRFRNRRGAARGAAFRAAPFCGGACRHCAVASENRMKNCVGANVIGLPVRYGAACAAPLGTAPRASALVAAQVVDSLGRARVAPVLRA